ncbi:glycosyltransferase family 2 protein [Microbacterium azadirachtae]|uniref:glycosyltransferase family 2 protein n=1 Tax=Microbacterium azadirachtae TaxID=582680 RepID=UPI003F750380
MILVHGHVVDAVLAVMTLFILSGIGYNLVLYALSLRKPLVALHRRRRGDGDQRPVVFVLPCLNEGQVIGASIDRLLTLWRPGIHILVVDDGSADDTSAAVLRRSHPALHLLQRTPPDARQGKGQALNAAIAYIRSGAVIEDIDPFDTLVCIVDADGRLDLHALDDVLPFFDDPAMGAVQLGVRINNRERNWLARMQDIEFVLYTNIYQRGRRHLGSVGLGGNGQFVRLAALDSLGAAPWSRSLTEDLDLGLRLHFRGWEVEFCPTAVVHQQGLVDVSKWIRQRTRWFQGHLQSWPLVPELLETTRGISRADLLYHVTSPFLQILSSVLSAGLLLAVSADAIEAALGTLHPSAWWLVIYLLTFGMSFFHARTYLQAERDHALTPVRAVVLLHGYVFYSLLWYAAAWRALGRTLLRRRSWAKTARLPEAHGRAQNARRGHGAQRRPKERNA